MKAFLGGVTDDSGLRMMSRGRGRRQMVQVFLLVALGYFTVKIAVSVTIFKRAGRSDLVIDSGYDKYGGIDAARVVNDDSNALSFVPFNPNLPKKVVVMTYQRCGSSFFGELFNTNPNVFYLYEPLDSLYSALYGTREGWNVPSDITTYFNGTERVIPEKERRAVATFLSHLLDCTTSALPTETLLHRFWFLFSNFHKGLRDFMSCLGENELKYSKCQSYTPQLCGLRFGQFPERMLQCNQNLWNSSYRSAEDTVMSKNITAYRKCMDGMREQLDEKCTHLFTKACEGKSLRSAKTVRATMHSMEYMLAKEDNLRVVHLIRDPRAVVLSRRNFDSSGRSHYAGGSMVREAEVYCRDVVRDVRHRHTLEKRFPGRIMTIIYDDLTLKPMEYAERIYQFVNTTLPSETRSWLLKNTNSEKRNSTKIASKWQEKLSYLTARAIMDKCKAFFQEVRYEFS